MGSKRVWQLKHTAHAHHTHTCARARERVYHVYVCIPAGNKCTRKGKTAGENASGVKKNYARRADERALFTVRMADYARRHANVRLFTVATRTSSGMTVICPAVKRGCEHDKDERSSTA